MAQQVAQVKKVKSTTPKVSNKPAHPKFIEMIVDGLKTLNERTGSSRQALLKFIMSKYQVDEKVAQVHLKMAIKNGVKNGSLKQLKGVGSNGSFKVGEAIKTKEAAKKKVAKKTAEKKADDKPKKNVKKIVKPKVPKTTQAKTTDAKKKVVKPKAATTTAAAAKPKVEKVKVVKKQTVKKTETSKAKTVKKTTAVKKPAKN